MSYDLTPAELPAFEAWLVTVAWPFATRAECVKSWRDQLAWQAGHDPHQGAEADAFALTPQAGPAAVDTTGDMFGIPAELAAATRAKRTGPGGPSGYPDLFTLEA